MNSQIAPQHKGLALAATSYPCTGTKTLAAPLVLLHGWGNDSRVWQPLIPLLQQAGDVITLDLPGFGDSPFCETIEHTLILLKDAVPMGANLLGWSLGGMLATRFAAQYPNRINKLITIATNLSFISRDNWPWAMAPKVLDSFIEQFAANPEPTLKQFSALEAKGDCNERALIRWLRNNSADAQPHWLNGLSWLGELDNRAAFSALTLPSLHLFGDADALLPVNVVQSLSSLNQYAQVDVLAGAGHAPHISVPQQVADSVIEFVVATETKQQTAACQPNPYQLEKKKIADSFGKAAVSYDSVAELQRQVGQKLLGVIEGVPTASSMADMGCGTGYFTEKLVQLNPKAACYGIDLSPGMIAYAASHHQQAVHWLCGDAESLPLPSNSLDLIFSNFVFQWCQNLPALMAEQYRLLAPGGQLAFSTVGPKSLGELRTAWQQVDQFVHVNQFAPLSSVVDSMISAGFDVRVQQTEELTRFYPQLNMLTKELKNLGAHNVNAGRQSALTGRQRIEALKSAYENFRQPQGLPATWEVFYLIARKAEGEQNQK